LSVNCVQYKYKMYKQVRESEPKTGRQGAQDQDQDQDQVSLAATVRQRQQ